jgi:hypothetical protein
MKFKGLGLLFVCLLIIQLVALHELNVSLAAGTGQLPDIYVGVDVAYANLTENKNLIDKVSAYTNLFIIGSSEIAYNEENLNEIAQYLFERNMSFIVYSDDARKISAEWFELAKTQWGNQFLGLYVWDEPGGKIVDRAYDWWGVYGASSYEEAEKQYVNLVSRYLSSFSRNAGTTPFFTSDYALYWYDYEAGYSTIFAEFGWNYSRQINTALCRGAAMVNNKDWGVMITWTYTVPPYIESGPELYNDMVLAYESGAKYIVVFDSNEDWTAGILQSEHFEAMEQFWQYVQNNPRKITQASERVAYVLPDYYAYGFRGPDDKIWGIWEADSIAYDLSMGVGFMLQQYGDNLDIVHENGQPANSYGYSAVVYWNDPRLFQPQLPDIPIPTPTPTPTPTSTATPPPTSTPSPSPSTLPTPSPTPEISPTPTQQASTPSSTENAYALLAAVVIASAVLTLVLAKKNGPKKAK